MGRLIIYYYLSESIIYIIQFYRNIYILYLERVRLLLPWKSVLIGKLYSRTQAERSTQAGQNVACRSGSFLLAINRSGMFPDCGIASPL